MSDNNHDLLEFADDDDDGDDATGQPDDCCCAAFNETELSCWPCYREGAAGDELVTDGSGARAVDPGRPEIPPYSDDNYDDRFGPGGGR